MTYILLIEDDPNIASSLQVALEQHGFSLHWAERGQDGLRYLKQHQPHLILLDVRLPDGSGFDFCRQIRLLQLRQPIIMLTVQREETDKVIGLEMGADDYVTKPFGLRELLSRIRAQLRRAYGELANSASDTLYVGDLVIDLVLNRVLREQQVIHLSPIEFRMLTYLARHPNQVLSRQQILQAVWPDHLDVLSEDVVKVNVRRLREKIELDPSNPRLLLTIPGVGYCLEVD